jgi:putative transposase
MPERQLITEPHNMFRISQFAQVMRALPREGFQRVVQAHEGDKHSKGFSCWDQLLVMSYGQLAGASGLRDLEVGFNKHRTQHYHLGTHEVRRSTLADANGKRNPQIFAEVARQLMGQVPRRMRREGERLMYLLDSTAITLTGPGFDQWTRATRTDHHQGVKTHVMYAVQAEAPCWTSITPANVNDIVEGVKVPLQAGAVYVFDKGYYDFGWWHQIEQAGAFFVTRFKRNVRLKTLQARTLPRQAAGVVLSDERVRFDNPTPRGGHRNPYTKPLRRVVVARPGHKTPLVLATNDLRSSALTVAQRYQDRWQVELFFKWIKQHLKIQRFVGRSENAVRIQILTALITYLLVALYRAAHRPKASMWEVLRELRLAPFQRAETESELFRRRSEHHSLLAKLQPSLFP